MSNWEKSKEIIRSVTSLKNKRVIDIGPLNIFSTATTEMILIDTIHIKE